MTDNASAYDFSHWQLFSVLVVDDEEGMRRFIGVDSLGFISLDGLYRACGEAEGRQAAAPQFCDACFSGDYPIRPRDAEAGLTGPGCAPKRLR